METNLGIQFMLKTRIIARLDIRGENLIKPVNLEGVRVVGDPQKYASKYNDEGIDEIIFMDAVASLYGRNSLESLLMRVSTNVFVPMTAAGGIRTVGDVGRMIRAGADKVAINTAAIKRPELITEVAEKYGSQAMVLQVDAKRKGDSWEVYTNGGREHTGKNVKEWIEEGISRGAGEILLTSIDQEGTRKGFDLELIKSITASVPVIASGGAGNVTHMVDALKNGADAIALADILHYNRQSISQIKSGLKEAGIDVRN